MVVGSSPTVGALPVLGQRYSSYLRIACASFEEHDGEAGVRLRAQSSALPDRLIRIRYSLSRPSDPGSSPGGGILAREIKAKADAHVH